MARLNLEVVTPEKIVVSEDVDTMVAPGSLGEFGILEGHAPFLTGIIPGELRYSSNDKTEYIAVTSGFAEISNDKIAVLVDAAEMSHEIDAERAVAARDRAQERLANQKSKKDDDLDFLRAEIALKRALIRIRVAEKKG